MRPSFTGLFSVCESAKAIVFLKFPLKSGPSYAIVREKTNFTDKPQVAQARNMSIGIVTLLKMCVTSLLCGSRADLWPFSGFLYERF